MRFLPPVAALADGPVSFDGDPYARERPMANLIDGLRQAGVDVEDGGRGRMPFTVHGRAASTAGRCTSTRPRRRSSCPACCSPGARYDKGIEVVHTGTGRCPRSRTST